MKPTIIISAVVVVACVVFLIARSRRGGAAADADAAVAAEQYQFIALLDPDGKFTYPQVPEVPDWYFQTTGIRMQMTKPDTIVADGAYMKTYNDALYKALKAQGKFHIIEENIAMVKANLDKQKP